MKKILLLALLGACHSYVFGQHYMHTAVWTRLGLNVRLGPKLNFTTEAGLRRQNSLHHLSPIEKPQTNNLKLTFVYALNNHLNLVLSPYENTYSNMLLGKEEDLKQPRIHEIRMSGGLEYIKRWERRRLQFRNLYEYRIFSSVVRHRIRSRLMSRYMVTPKTTFTIADEVFINIPPHRLPNWFNQNRLSCTFTHSFTPYLDLEAGYIYVFTERITLSEFDHTNGLILYLTVKL